MDSLHTRTETFSSFYTSQKHTDSATLLLHFVSLHMQVSYETIFLISFFNAGPYKTKIQYSQYYLILKIKLFLGYTLLGFLQKKQQPKGIKC